MSFLRGTGIFLHVQLVCELVMKKYSSDWLYFPPLKVIIMSAFVTFSVDITFNFVAPIIHDSLKKVVANKCVMNCFTLLLSVSQVFDNVSLEPLVKTKKLGTSATAKKIVTVGLFCNLSIQKDRDWLYVSSVDPSIMLKATALSGSAPVVSFTLVVTSNIAEIESQLLQAFTILIILTLVRRNRIFTAAIRSIFSERGGF